MTSMLLAAGPSAFTGDEPKTGNDKEETTSSADAIAFFTWLKVTATDAYNVTRQKARHNV